jgi:hypothetical protein
VDHSREEGNMMHAFWAGPDLGLGQQFRVHFFNLSWIQEMKLGSQPSVSRACYAYRYDHQWNDTRPCPSEQFN